MTTTGYGTAAAPELVPAAPVDQHPPRRWRRPQSGSIARWVILLIAAIYFIGPLIAAVSFSLEDGHGGATFSAYRQIFAKPATGQISFLSALVYSLEIAVVTIVLTLALMLPTQLLLHLRLPKWRGLVGVSDVFQSIQPGKNDPAGTGGLPVIYPIVTWLRDADHPFVLALLYVIP